MEIKFKNGSSIDVLEHNKSARGQRAKLFDRVPLNEVENLIDLDGILDNYEVRIHKLSEEDGGGYAGYMCDLMVFGDGDTRTEALDDVMSVAKDVLALILLDGDKLPEPHSSYLFTKNRKLFCEHCDDFVDHELVEVEKEYLIEGETIKVKQNEYKCDKCGTLNLTISLYDHNLMKAGLKYRKKKLKEKGLM